MNASVNEERRDPREIPERTGMPSIIPSTLPEWDELPSIPLYMDQIVLLINTYLDPEGISSKEKNITPAMINNYIKQKIMPPTVKKHYFRHHLACLLIICILKESVNISDIPQLLPDSMTESDMKEVYTHFLSVYRSTAEENQRHYGLLFGDIDLNDRDDTRRAALQLALSSTMSVSLFRQYIDLPQRSQSTLHDNDQEAPHE